METENARLRQEIADLKAGPPGLAREGQAGEEGEVGGHKGGKKVGDGLAYQSNPPNLEARNPHTTQHNTPNTPDTTNTRTPATRTTGTSTHTTHKRDKHKTKQKHARGDDDDDDSDEDSDRDEQQREDA